MEVPAGSRLILKFDDAIDSGRMSPGQRFTSSLQASLLDAGGKELVPVGTKVLGVIVDARKAGNVAGRSELELAFTDLEIQGRLFPIQSQEVEAVGEGSGRDTARKVGVGALIGGVAGGGKGAATGAAIGGGLALMTRGKQIKIPAGTTLELSLTAPAKVPAPALATPSAAPASAPVAATPGTPAASAGPVAAAAPAAATATPAAGAEPEKDCVKKLMANGFSADEALSSCKKK